MRDPKLTFVKNKLSEIQHALEEICNECGSTRPCSECLLMKARRDVKTIKAILGP